MRVNLYIYCYYTWFTWHIFTDYICFQAVFYLCFPILRFHNQRGPDSKILILTNYMMFSSFFTKLKKFNIRRKQRLFLLLFFFVCLFLLFFFCFFCFVAIFFFQLYRKKNYWQSFMMFLIIFYKVIKLQNFEWVDGVSTWVVASSPQLNIPSMLIVNYMETFGIFGWLPFLM